MKIEFPPFVFFVESVSGDKGHASKIRSGKPKSHANKLYLQTAAAMALKNANWKS